MSTVLEKCPLCESQEFALRFIARDRHYGIAGTFQIVKCENCGLLFLNPMYTNDELADFYPTDYYAYQSQSTSAGWKQRMRGLLGFSIQTKDPVFESPGRFLDIGCGSGWFLEEMKKHGWTTFGVEVNPAAAKLGQEQMLNIFCGAVQKVKFPDDYFDYIRLNHSFEHIPDPVETLNEIRRILKPQGRLLIGVPNVDSLNAGFFGQYWWYLGAPVHTFNYSVRTLPRLLEASHFEVERVNFNSDYSGILGSIQIWKNRNTDKRSHHGFLFNNPLAKILTHGLAKIFDMFRLGDVIEIIAHKKSR